MDDIINRIKSLFLSEAQNSPLLFNDLANMEKYISESYSGRSLIELLQNADDAGANRFYIVLSHNVYIVANDGRPFTSEDMLALCRSGASTKTRKSNTIGFRGIGFKAVVNYADIVHLASGDIEATFSRQLTRQCVDNSKAVPLIRIPHAFAGNQFRNVINALHDEGFSTVFIFEARNNALENELKEFDSSCMLFLQSVNEVVFNAGIEKIYSISRKKQLQNFLKVTAKDDRTSQDWLVSIPTGADEKCSIACKLENKEIVAANVDEAVVHSFMPTHNALSIPIKINGDFSTDPSRTRVVIDQDSDVAAKNCARVVSNIVTNSLQAQQDFFGIFSILKKAKLDPLSQIRGKDINDIFIEYIARFIREFIDSMAGGKDIFLQPVGITDKDFTDIIDDIGAYGIGNRLQEKIPDLLEGLKAFGFKELPTEKSLRAMRNLECSASTRAAVLTDVINKTRFIINSDLKDDIVNAKLIEFESGVKPLADICGTDLVEANFEGAVSQKLSSSADYTAFAKKVGLQQNQLAMNNRLVAEANEHTIASVAAEKSQTVFTKRHVIQKWRSVEKNVAAVLELLNDVDYVEDVSKQNLGYDLEAILKDGSSRYYEVKSVSSLGDLISITNNEYSTAVHFKDSYYLAVACQNNKTIEVCFVKDPIHTLTLSKRVTRWEWICDEYQGEVISSDMLD